MAVWARGANSLLGQYQMVSRAKGGVARLGSKRVRSLQMATCVDEGASVLFAQNCPSSEYHFLSSIRISVSAEIFAKIMKPTTATASTPAFTSPPELRSNRKGMRCSLPSTDTTQLADP